MYLPESSVQYFTFFLIYLYSILDDDDDINSCRKDGKLEIKYWTSIQIVSILEKGKKSSLDLRSRNKEP